MEKNNVPQVYAAICAVMADIGQTGIAKGRENKQQGYQFRGIDDVYNELNGLLSKHMLIMTPRVLSRELTERQTQRGGSLFYVTVEAEFDLISAKDGSTHTIRTLGEAMDSGDKATNKAMSAAYKYAAMMVFCIPTEGDNDADATTQENVSPRERQLEDNWQQRIQEPSQANERTMVNGHGSNGRPAVIPQIPAAPALRHHVPEFQQWTDMLGEAQKIGDHIVHINTIDDLTRYWAELGEFLKAVGEKDAPLLAELRAAFSVRNKQLRGKGNV